MKAVRLHGYGGIDQFRLEEVPDPVPGPGEALVKVAASGLNPVDAMIRQGWLAQYIPLQFPAILGVDAAGTVVSLGEGANGFKVGDRVIVHLPVTGNGVNAEIVRAPVAGLAKLPANVDFEAGATLPLPGLSGRQAVNALEVKAGNRVLVSGALGAVGRAAVQYLQEIGAVPVAGVRPQRLSEGRALAGEAIDVSATPTAPGFDYAVSAADSAAANVLKFVRDGGKVASLVLTPEDANPNGRVKVIQVMAHSDPILLEKIAGAAGRGELTIPVAQTFKLGEIARAHDALAAKPHGKIVVLH
jgi:NADPH:quinone reductase-like Zn-dependent oxidoreductase